MKCWQNPQQHFWYPAVVEVVTISGAVHIVAVLSIVSCIFCWGVQLLNGYGIWIAAFPCCKNGMFLNALLKFWSLVSCNLSTENFVDVLWNAKQLLCLAFKKNLQLARGRPLLWNSMYLTVSTLFLDSHSLITMCRKASSWSWEIPANIFGLSCTVHTGRSNSAIFVHSWFQSMVKNILVRLASVCTPMISNILRPIYLCPPLKVM